MIIKKGEQVKLFLILLLLLVGCEPKLRYGDVVNVTDGFYEGNIGIINNMYSGMYEYRCQVIFSDGNHDFVPCRYLKKVKDDNQVD